ncbi:ribonuclease H-like domain-containing protein [Mycena galericulata]|nr:ribonuclease H-like domain-containing protein [Mycena galericulata]
MDIGITQNDTEDRGLGDRDPLEPFPSDFTMFYATTERQANECLEHITGGDVGFDAEFTKRRPTAEESLIDLALTTGPAHKKAAILGWQIVELGSGSFTVAWDNIGLRLVQIAHEDNVWVFDMWKIRAIPKELVRILLSPNIKKGGVALSNDITVVWDDLRIEMRNMVDVGLMSKLALIGKYPSAPYTNLSLKVAVEDILGFAIEKDLGKSNWAADKLLDDQIQYAALDAVASLRLLQALGSMLDKAMEGGTDANQAVISGRGGSLAP